MEATPVAQSVRDDPEWQAAQADYLSDEGAPDEVLTRRIRAAYRLRDIEIAHKEQS